MIYFSKFIDQNGDLKGIQYQCLNTQEKKKEVFQPTITFSCKGTDFVRQNGT